LFPIYSELKEKTNQECLRSFSIGTYLVTLLYTSFSVLAIYMFGSSLESNVLSNVGHQCTTDQLTGKMECPWESVAMRVMFLIVIACHMPFIFFSGKESLLIIIDEIDRRSISKALELKIHFLE
jgi:amino acid permease